MAFRSESDNMRNVYFPGGRVVLPTIKEWGMFASIWFVICAFESCGALIVGHKSDKRAQDVSALGLIADDPMAIETAEHALQDSKSDVRKAAVTALADMNSRASLPKIKALLKHSDGKPWWRSQLCLKVQRASGIDHEGFCRFSDFHDACP